jgi:FkbM family methyltransferase
MSVWPRFFCLLCVLQIPSLSGAIHYEVAITSFEREHSYLCTTLKSILGSTKPENVKLFHGSGLTNAKILSNCTNVAQNVVHIFPRRSSGVLDLYFRVLSRRTRGLSLLVVEDDIILDPDFDNLLELLVQQVESHNKGSSYILSLYNGVVESSEGWCPQNPWCTDNLQLLKAKPRPAVHRIRAILDGWGFGTQAVFFHGEYMLRSLQLFFRSNRTHSDLLQDLFLKTFAANSNVSVWGVERSLCQHIGVYSSLFGTSRPHESLTFMPNVSILMSSLSSTDSSAYDEKRRAHDKRGVCPISSTSSTNFSSPTFRTGDRLDFVQWDYLHTEVGTPNTQSSNLKEVDANIRCCIAAGPRTCIARFWLRPGTTDSAVLAQVVAKDEYGFLSTLKLPTPDSILDAGANCGIATVLFAHFFPLAKIISVEASSANFEALNRNIEHLHRVRSVNAAIWDSRGNVSVNFGSRQGREWDNVVSSANMSAPAEINEILAVSISDMLHTFSLSKFDFLKIDIEGSEKRVFSADTKPWLSAASFIAVEIHDDLQAGATRAVFDAVGRIGSFCHLRSGEYDVWLNNATRLMKKYCRNLRNSGLDCCGHSIR